MLAVVHSLEQSSSLPHSHASVGQLHILWLIFAISAVLVSATFFHLKTYILLFCDASNITLAVRHISWHFNVMSDGLILSQDLCFSCSGSVVLEPRHLCLFTSFSDLQFCNVWNSSSDRWHLSLRSIGIERGWHRCNSAFDSLPHVCRSSQVSNDSKQSHLFVQFQLQALPTTHSFVDQVPHPEGLYTAGAGGAIMRVHGWQAKLRSN